VGSAPHIQKLLTIQIWGSKHDFESVFSRKNVIRVETPTFIAENACCVKDMNEKPTAVGRLRGFAVVSLLKRPKKKTPIRNEPRLP